MPPYPGLTQPSLRLAQVTAQGILSQLRGANPSLVFDRKYLNIYKQHNRILTTFRKVVFLLCIRGKVRIKIKVPTSNITR